MLAALHGGQKNALLPDLPCAAFSEAQSHLTFSTELTRILQPVPVISHVLCPAASNQGPQSKAVGPHGKLEGTNPG